MSVVLICLILGLAIAIERIIGLTIASTNTEKLLEDTKNALRNGGLDEAKVVTAKVPGPVASIFTQGLMRYHKGVEAVEKSIIQSGGVEMGKLEKGMTWVALFIALAPMFGFMGTVIGMINAFDEIQQSETIKIDEVAGGIKQALLTTVAGLIVAVILQIVYNFCISKIDAIVNQMEEASINFVDMLLEEEEKGALKQ
jgi:biopolymer transport protein ExbB